MINWKAVQHISENSVTYTDAGERFGYCRVGTVLVDDETELTRQAHEFGFTIKIEDGKIFAVKKHES